MEKVLQSALGHSFVRSAPRPVARELLPLPEVPSASPASGKASGLSRSVVRRLQARRHVDDWLNSGIRALNSLGAGAGFESAAAVRPSAAQLKSIAGLRKAYQRIGPPPVGMRPRGAWSELQGPVGGYSDASAGALSIFREGKVALPPAGRRAVDLCEVLPSVDRELILNEKALLSSDACVAENFAKCRVESPHMDPRLARSPRLCSAFVRDLHRRGIVKYGAKCRSSVGAFLF